MRSPGSTTSDTSAPAADAPAIAAPSPGMDLADTSVAGEEDPGACDDLAAASSAAMAPGDQAPAGTPGTGEAVCPRCGGSGRCDGGSCPVCEGTGHVTQGVGGA